MTVFQRQHTVTNCRSPYAVMSISNGKVNKLNKVCTLMMLAINGASPFKTLVKIYEAEAVGKPKKITKTCVATAFKSNTAHMAHANKGMHSKRQTLLSKTKRQFNLT